jgi:oligogalacturonide lyase
MGKGTIRQLQFHTRTDPDTGRPRDPADPRRRHLPSQLLLPEVLHQRRQSLLFAGEFGPARRRTGTTTCWTWPDGQARQLTEGQGENTFGGFLSPDDRHLYFVRAERQLMRLALDDLQRGGGLHRARGLGGLRHLGGQQRLHPMVGIEIAASDWFPLSDWQKFHEMFHSGRAAG